MPTRPSSATRLLIRSTVKIQRIDDVAEAFKKPADYYVIDMLGKGRPLVLERKVEEARDRISARYQVTSHENLQK